MPILADFAQLFKNTVALFTDYERNEIQTAEDYKLLLLSFNELIGLIEENREILQECVREIYKKPSFSEPIQYFLNRKDIFSLCMISDNEYKNGDIRNHATPGLTQQIVWIFLTVADRTWLKEKSGVFVNVDKGSQAANCD